MWHKTHVIEHRDILLKVLHKSQAVGKGALSGTDSNTPILIDPRLLYDSTTPLVSVSPNPFAKPKTAYNRSRKRAKTKGSDNKDEGIVAPAAKKVDLGYTILSLSVEIARGRKAQEEHKSA
jgi:hypothetical protein